MTDRSAAIKSISYKMAEILFEIGIRGVKKILTPRYSIPTRPFQETLTNEPKAPSREEM